MFSDELPKRKNELTQETCPICGGIDFERGNLYQTRYRAGSGVWGGGMGWGKVVGARRCLTCDSLFPFVDEATTRKQNQWGLVIVVLVMLPILFIFLGAMCSSAAR